MTRRPGLTMTEALVAIFITAIGLVGVMSMFPFGAKQMSDALIADRSTSLANSIDGLVRSYWREKVADDTNMLGSGEPFYTAMDSPGTHPASPIGTGATLPTISSSSTEPSYPVFLDPMGVLGRTTANNQWVGDITTPTSLTYVPRRNMNVVGSPSQALRLFSQPDGFAWDEESRPKMNYDAKGQPTSSSEMRELRYNALAVLQRPVNSARNNATLKIVVFINRRHQFYPQGSEAVFPNATSSATISFLPTSTAIRISTAADIRKGSWIMDATIDGTVRHANFYRVVSATDDGTGFYDVELHTPIKRVDGGTNAYNATVVIMPGVADVFDRPALNGNTN
ncbi:unnamed protein product [Gemmata massiliana]|uniref:Uncharacterized protein n=1 Tax=Gemmata massiliana TaxID=1210884 RepID=A0A6P2CTV9_9BACT|nr:hypothetical protein [Gemmata massiliana]VTR91124.1 unnamed protein product [Gemmata massiliana]